MFVVVHFKDGVPCGGRSPAGNKVVYAFLFDTYKAAERYGKDTASITHFNYKIFKEAEG